MGIQSFSKLTSKASITWSQFIAGLGNSAPVIAVDGLLLLFTAMSGYGSDILLWGTAKLVAAAFVDKLRLVLDQNSSLIVVFDGETPPTKIASQSLLPAREERLWPSTCEVARRIPPKDPY